jgi:curved DNA-binding protein
MEYKDYYKILGVDRKASAEEIKRVYRKLARQLHPDVNPDDSAAEARFKDINEAYQVLGDPDKRIKYDQLGSNYQQYQRAGHDPGGYDWSQWYSQGGASRGAPGGVRVEFNDLNDILGGSGFSDFFNSLFGAGGSRAGHPQARRSRRVSRGQDLEQVIEISLEEAFRGTTRTLERDGKRLAASIPAGAKTGTKVRLGGQGAPTAAPSGGPAGDLFLKIKVRPHGTLTRDNDDLRMEAQVDIYTAVLGGDVLIETLDEKVQLKIPAGTQSGQVFRLRGKGMPSLKGKSHGDLFVKVMLQVPENLSKKEKELYQELANIRKR